MVYTSYNTNCKFTVYASKLNDRCIKFNGTKFIKKFVCTSSMVYVSPLIAMYSKLRTYVQQNFGLVVPTLKSTGKA